ncbi:GrdX family protein [Fusobacterium sp.]|uniref:GrdX family protein n=1 Tax=Fusobacterium sp. TaxID=68766 RepID=UPI0025C168C0|nr:GrdX family protein [Fusobacterium sp.]
MDYIIITNNSKVYNIYKESNEVLFFQKKDLLELLEIIRGKIYEGHILLSDPILSNLNNFDNPYKSIAISRDNFLGDLFIKDDSQQKFIDTSINIAKKLPFREKINELSEKKLEEYRFIDLNLLVTFIKKFDNF